MKLNAVLSVRNLIAAGVLASVGATSAASFSKANNSTALNVAAAWTNNAVPGASDVAAWDGNVPGPLTNALGANLSWRGLQVLNPGGPIQIEGANTLTLGVGGIDLSAATQDLNLSNNVTLGGVPQNWRVASGRTLNVGATLGRTAGGVVRFYQPDDNSANIYVTNPPLALLQNGNIVFGTVNDTDFAGIDGSQRVVGGVNLGVYNINPAGVNPNISGTAINRIYDFTESGSYGVRASGNAVIYGVRINQPNANNIPWQINVDNKTVTANAILITTNAGNLPVRVIGIGGFLRIGSSGTQELLLIQNNPAAPLVFTAGFGTISQQGAGSITKLGAGTVEIQSAATYSGVTRVFEGTLLISGAGRAGTGAVNVFGGNFAGAVGATNASTTVVASGATNTIVVNAVNGQFFQAANLTLSSGARLQFNVSNSVALSTTIALLVITNNGTTLFATNSVGVDVVGALTVGQFPLIKYAALGGDGFAAFQLGTIQPHTTAFLSNNVANSTIDLVVTANNQPLRWATGSGVWDVNTTANWRDATSAVTTYQQSGSFGDAVVFEDTLSGASPLTVTLNTQPTPASVTINATKNFTFSGAGGIAGSAALTKSGNGTLTLNTANSFAGGLNLNGGTTVFNALANLGNGAISFSGGVLQFAPGNIEDISVRTVTFNAGGATINDDGNTLWFTKSIGNGGAGGLTKLGAGSLTLNGTNIYSGNTIVGAGSLALGPSSYISNSPALIVNSGATLDVVNSPLALQNQVLAGGGILNGSVSIAAGATLSPATNGAAGTFTVNNGDVSFDGGTLTFDLSTTTKDELTINGNLALNSGTLQLNVSGTLTNGSYKLIGYTGSLLTGAGSAANLTVIGFAQAGKSAVLSDATPNEIRLIVGDVASDTLTWSGTGADWDLAGSANWLRSGSPWAFTNGSFVTFNDSGAANPYVNLTDTLQPSTVTVNASADYTFSGAGKISGTTSLAKSGVGTLNILTANNNSGATTINSGTIRVGNGGVTGDLGSGNITNHGSLIFQQPDSRTVAGAIRGSGNVEQQGSATLTLASNNTYTGPTTISSGALQVGTGGAAGTLGSAAVVNNGELILNRSGAVSFTNNISGTGSFATIGAATVTLNNANTYFGNTAIINGVVKLGAAEKIPDAVTVPGSSGGLFLGGTLDLNGFNETLNAIIGGSGVLTNSGVAGTNTLTLGDESGGVATFTSKIAEGAAAKIKLVKQGNNTQFLYPGNNFSAGTVLSNGVLAGVSVNDGLANSSLLGSGPVTFYGGTLQLSGFTGATAQPGYGTFANLLIIPTNQAGTIRPAARGLINSTVTGSGTLNFIARFTRSDIGGDWSGFTGNLNIIANGAADDFRVNTATGFPNTKVHVGQYVNFYNLIAGAIIPIGELSGDAGGFLPIGATGMGGAQAATWRVGLLNTTTNFDGNITDATGIIKDGTGAWILNGANTYTGITAVTNGTLVLGNDGAASPNTLVFDLRSSTAKLDVSALSGSTLNVGAAQTLRGNGTVLGSANVAGTLAPGQGIGTLTVTNAITLAGSAVFEINRTNTPATNDLLVAASVGAGGDLIVTNLGPDLITGSVFKLFSVPVSGSFANVILPQTNVPGSITYQWDNKLAVDGTLVLVAGASAVNTTPTSLVSSYNNGALTLSWPADRTGWRLETQTNAPGVGLTDSWVTVAGSAATNQVSIPVGATQGSVFFRLVYP